MASHFTSIRFRNYKRVGWTRAMHRRVAVSVANPTALRSVRSQRQRNPATAAETRPLAFGSVATDPHVAVSAANPTAFRSARTQRQRNSATAAETRPFAFGSVAADAHVVGFAALTTTLRNLHGFRV